MSTNFHGVFLSFLRFEFLVSSEKGSYERLRERFMTPMIIILSRASQVAKTWGAHCSSSPAASSTFYFGCEHFESRCSWTMDHGLQNIFIKKLWGTIPRDIEVIFTLFEKSNFCPKIQFWQKTQNPNISRVYHQIFFFKIFLVKSKLSTAKKSKTTTFSRFFSPKKIRQFSREIKVEFLDKKWRFRTVCI